ncbi:MAG: hypothetical protein O3A01_00115 [bacterium]|nr:hypothetical protein [bacterium]
MDESQQTNLRMKASTAQTGRHHAVAFHPQFDQLFKDAFEKESSVELGLEDKRTPKTKASVRQLRETSRAQYVNNYTYEDTSPSSDVLLSDEEADMWDILSEF